MLVLLPVCAQAETRALPGWVVSLEQRLQHAMLALRAHPSGRRNMRCPLRRLWHADVLEWVWFLNSHPEVMYRSMYGDKDTFRLAFHLAGKPEAFAQVAMPPRAVLDATPEDVRALSYPPWVPPLLHTPPRWCGGDPEGYFTGPGVSERRSRL